MNTDYLMAAVNQMTGILELSTQLNRKTRQSELVECARIGCETFIHLSNDQTFYRDIQVLAARKQENLLAFFSITGDMDHFLYHFLELEERILSESGASPVLIKVLHQEAERLMDSVRDTDFDIQALRNHVGRLQEIACNIARGLLTHQAQDAEKETHKQSLRSLTLAIGGAAIIGLNASTPLLSQAGSAASGALGIRIMESNLAKVLDKKAG